MKLKDFLKNNIKTPGFWICVGGYIALALAYILWLGQSSASLWGKTLAFASVAMFSTVCLRFVPGWMEFWAPRIKDSAHDSGMEPKNMLPKIFFALLAYIFCIILLVYALRGVMGHGWDFKNYLSFWTGTDSYHYLCIARDWYISEGDWDRMVQLVFLPGYPLAIRLVNIVIGNWLYSGLITSALCFAGTGCVVYRLQRLDHSHEHSLRTVKYLCIIPGSFFFAAPMSESLFMLLCALCLYFSRREKWLLACLCGGFAAFTRSLGMALFVPVLFDMVSHYAKNADRRSFARFALLLLIPAGFGAYCFINYQVSGDAFKYMEYQSVHWGQNLGLFFNTAAYQLDNAIARFGSDRALFWGLWLPNLLAQFSALGVMIAAAKRLRAGYTAWFIAYFFVAIGATWLLSAPRYLAGLLVMPMALAYITDSRKANIIATAVCAVFGFAYLLAFAARWQVW